MLTLPPARVPRAEGAGRRRRGGPEGRGEAGPSGTGRRCKKRAGARAREREIDIYKEREGERKARRSIRESVFVFLFFNFERQKLWTRRGVRWTKTEA